MDEHDASVLGSIAAFREAGFALHWLHPRTKRPIGNEWSTAPVATLDELRATHRPGYNLGVRPGEFSRLTGGKYLHVFDLDIRDPELSEEAWEALESLFPDVDFSDFPMIISGSGGESRHIHVVTDKPFSSKTLAVSEGKHRALDPATGKERWRYDWEIELFGTGKHLAMPPSIHPDTGLPYTWEAPYTDEALEFGLWATIDAAVIEPIVAQTATYAFETREPLTFEPGQLERDLDDVPVSHIDDYADWISLGQALHHQFGGSAEGYALWLLHSKRSQKFDGKQMMSRWRGFGRNRKPPVTMGTVRQWAIDARRTRLIASFDEEEGDDFLTTPAPPINGGNPPKNGDSLTSPAPPSTAAAIDDLLGGDTPAPAPSTPALDIDDMLGEAEATPLGTPDLDWMSLLDFTDAEKPVLKGTLHNVELIVANDPRLFELPQLNEFTQEIVQRTPPGLKPARRANQAKPVRQLEGRVWGVADRLNGDLWSDDRDFAIRSVLEAPKTQGGYGMKLTDRDLKAAISLVAQRNAFHPVREYLNSLTWDGTVRAERLWIDYVGAPDDTYHRDVARLMLIAAVTRIFEPGHKFDFATILEGLQGKGKSTLIATLGKSWFAELDGDFHDPKQMIELMQGAWIIEIPELTGFSRADVRAIKAFISRQTDRARLAYARRAGAFPRQNVFVGSTNDGEYLKDDSGGRRFWPVACTVGEIDTGRLALSVDHLWAEAVVLYRAMRAAQPVGTLPLYLTDSSSRTTASRLQESRRVESSDDGTAGRIWAWLDRPVTDGGFEDETDGGEPEVRNYTCLMQIFVEALGNDIRQYDQGRAQGIGRAMLRIPGWEKVDGEDPKVNFGGVYGRQRAYRRIGAPDKTDRLF